MPDKLDEIKQRWFASESSDCSYAVAKGDVALLLEEVSSLDEAWRAREHQIFLGERDFYKAANLIRKLRDALLALPVSTALPLTRELLSDADTFLHDALR